MRSHHLTCSIADLTNKIAYNIEILILHKNSPTSSFDERNQLRIASKGSQCEERFTSILHSREILNAPFNTFLGCILNKHERYVISFISHAYNVVNANIITRLESFWVCCSWFIFTRGSPVSWVMWDALDIPFLLWLCLGRSSSPRTFRTILNVHCEQDYLILAGFLSHPFLSYIGELHTSLTTISDNTTLGTN